MDKLTSAELYAKEIHLGKTDDDGKTPYWKHLEGIVTRLKNIGVSDQDVLCAAWLHGTIDHNVTFDEINQRFGKKIAVMVLSLSRDTKLPKKEMELQFVKQLKNAPFEMQLVELCEVSSGLKELKNSSLSNNKKMKLVKKKLHYLNVIKPAVVQNRSRFSGIEPILDGINNVLIEYRQKPLFCDNTWKY